MGIEQCHVPVLVLGGGSGGFAAALQSARSDVQTLLLTPGPWVGGMLTSGGVSAPDGNELSAWQTGLWGALLRQLRHELSEGLDHNWVSCFGFRPQQAEAILQRWIQQSPALQWWSAATVLELQRQGDRLQSALVQHADQLVRISFDVLIDGTELGESLELAQIPHRVGWEARELWHEPSAPTAAQLKESFFQAEPLQSPTWVIHAQWQGEWTPPAQPLQPLEDPFAGCCDRFPLDCLLSYGRLPGGQLMLNWPLRGNDWPIDPGAVLSGDPNRIRSQLDGMRAHSEAFLRQLQRASGPALIPAKAFNGKSMAHQPYWREGRRLIGEATVTELDLLPESPNHDHQFQSVAVGNYVNDHHYSDANWPLAPKSMLWGGRSTGTPFVIPYGALYSSDICNLLMADKSISVSHMANGATRMGPLLLQIGQAAGQAAALCVQFNQSVRELNVQQLQMALLSDAHAPSGLVTSPELAWHHNRWHQLQRQRLAGDDPAIEPLSAPDEPGCSLLRFKLSIEAGQWWGETPEGKRWSLISLEPCVQKKLPDLNGRWVELVGWANPWGPWWRVIRVNP